MKIISLKHAVKPRNGVTSYAVIQSRTRGTRLNHSVVRVGRKFDCSCEDSILNQNKDCDHIKTLKVALRAQTSRYSR
jgi:predicted nucleic acid-binding Zn finger protein